MAREGSPLTESKRASDVTKVNPNEWAVAARKRSAGSRWRREIFLVARTTSAVRGASRIGASFRAWLIHSSTLLCDPAPIRCSPFARQGLRGPGLKQVSANTCMKRNSVMLPQGYALLSQ